MSKENNVKIKEIEENINRAINFINRNKSKKEHPNRIANDIIKGLEQVKLFAIHNVSINSGVIRTERGWAGHFISADKCMFKRNTLLTYNDIMIVVSTVGRMKIDGEFDAIGAGRYFETMAFHADKNDKKYFDADISKRVYFDSDCSIPEVYSDDKANEMHEAVIAEISTKLEQGYKFDVTSAII